MVMSSHGHKNGHVRAYPKVVLQDSFGSGMQFPVRSSVKLPHRSTPKKETIGATLQPGPQGRPIGTGSPYVSREPLKKGLAAVSDTAEFWGHLVWLKTDVTFRSHQFRSFGEFSQPPLAAKPLAGGDQVQLKSSLKKKKISIKISTDAMFPSKRRSFERNRCGFMYGSFPCR